MKFEKEEEETEKGDFEKKSVQQNQTKTLKRRRTQKQFKCDAIPVECEKHD